MKHYNIQNYIRYKKDLEKTISRIKIKEHYSLYDRNTLITLFMPLVENIARKFKESDAANGVVSLSDRIQFGHIGLIKAVDKIIWSTITESKDPEKTLKSYLAKRIRGAIRRSTDANRSPMRIPEHKLNDIRNNFDNNEKNQALFFNSMFSSIDQEVEDNMLPQFVDESSDPMKKEKLSRFIQNIMLKHLTEKEYHVIRLSFGINCDKLSAKQIAEKLNMKGSSSYVRVSQLKKQAIEKLKDVINHSQVVDYL